MEDTHFHSQLHVEPSSWTFTDQFFLALVCNVGSFKKGPGLWWELCTFPSFSYLCTPDHEKTTRIPRDGAMQLPSRGGEGMENGEKLCTLIAIFMWRVRPLNSKNEQPWAMSALANQATHMSVAPVFPQALGAFLMHKARICAKLQILNWPGIGGRWNRIAWHSTPGSKFGGSQNKLKARSDQKVGSWMLMGQSTWVKAPILTNWMPQDLMFQQSPGFHRRMLWQVGSLVSQPKPGQSPNSLATVSKLVCPCKSTCSWSKKMIHTYISIYIHIY